ncbi:cytosolic carboxypeptidase 4 isoform X2 [Orussus abietinus]|uniref:cytosolic carboxypeptidase 4 isoform X2 n=1 Tax=Orussus abietinus TaxID=222816 RepID=UPI000C715E4B|nr:cytosolic carboxypeptidase 4 isoform X2 [Orussus abietinus]
MKRARQLDKENDQPDKIGNFNNAGEEINMSLENKTEGDIINEALFEKLEIYAQAPQENVDAIRSHLVKIHARITSSERRIREYAQQMLWRENSDAVKTFLKILENCKDNVANCSAVSIIHECISPRTSKVKCKGFKHKNATRNNCRAAITQLINFGGTQVMIKLLNNLQRRDIGVVEMLLQEVLYILGQVAQRDHKFATKVKSLNATKSFHSLLKEHYNDSRTLLPLLLIVKALARNPFSQQVLIKDGIAGTLEKTLVSLGYTPHLKMKTLLESFKYFTINKLYCMKFVKAGIVHSLMRIFERWNRFDGPMRLKICNYALNTMQHICMMKSGRKAIKSNNGLQVLYRFSTSCPEDKAYDTLLSRVYAIFNQCLEKKELPVPEMSPARFILPVTSTRMNSADSCSDIDSQVNGVAGLDKYYSDADSDIDEDDDDSKNSRKPRETDLVDEIDENNFFSGVITSLRSEEDLMGYHVFYRELGDRQAQLSLGRSFLERLFQLPGTMEDNKRSYHQALNKLIMIGNKSSSNGASEKISATDNSQRIHISGTPKVFDNLTKQMSDKHVYCLVASAVKSVIGFVKVAYPDLVGGRGSGKLEPLNRKDRKVCRSKLLVCLDRNLHPDNFTHVTVYDLDELSSSPGNNTTPKLLCNWDEERVGMQGNDSKQLQFESRFESGNLRKAIQIGLREYELILSPDVNSGSRHQWFYFEVSNMDANVPYTFDIVNCEKANSQFNFGMKPILFSVKESQLGRPGWIRTGVDICYYRNCYQRPARGKNYLTTSFTINFPHSYDVCYVAYHFPYTYSQLMTSIWKWSKELDSSSILFRAEPFCTSLNTNESPLLTITAPDSKSNSMHNRKMIFLTSRVHPGESNSSWIMHGTLEALLSPSDYASSLRDDYIFKVVPMLNIEGVVNGCNRYGLTNEDLNRRWSNPDQVLHPVIYHTKGLMEYSTKVLQRPLHVFVDYHGHSRRKNVFLFGCSKSGSWSAADRSKPDQPMQYLMLPHLMQKISPAFAMSLCSFKVERKKESTARVAIWRQLGVSRSYTMESSFCGCDQGPLAGFHLDTKHLKDIGIDFCQALSMMKDGGEEWNVDMSGEESCCPLKCILGKSKKPPKCIQDKDAKYHFTETSLFRKDM